MSNYQGTIAVKLANEVFPDELIEKLLEENASVAGFAVAVEENGSPVIKMDFSDDGNFSIDDVKGLQTADQYLDSTCIFFFGKFPEKFATESIQPFPVVIDENGDAACVAFLDGNFDENAVAGSKFSEAYDVTKKLLAPTLQRMYKGAGKDVAEFMDELSKDPAIPDLFNMWYKGRATITILANNGEMATFGDNALRVEYSFGWVSNPCGYEGEVEEEKPTITQRVKRTFGSGAKKSEPEASVTASPDKGKTTAPSRGSQVRTAVHVDEADKYHAPPKSATKGEKSEFYLRENEGIIPPGYKDCPPILKMEFRPVKSLKDPKLQQVAANKRPIADVVPAVQKGKAVTTEILPVIPKDQKGKLKNFVAREDIKKILNEGRNVLPPERIKEIVEEYPTFPETAGLDGLENTFAWPYEVYVQLGNDVGIEALARLTFDLNLAYQEVLSELEDPNEEIVEEEKVEEAVPTKRKFGTK